MIPEQSAVGLGALDPGPQGLGVDIELVGDALHGAGPGSGVAAGLHGQPGRALAELVGEQP
ncbi:hypothetical protein HEP84_56975 [Streptomyces sp. RLB1-33]|nr:hypothetical protein [Streptomyces sp. RLB1-33]